MMAWEHSPLGDLDPALVKAALRTAAAAAGSRRAITELLREGETAVDSGDIFDSFPDHVEQDGELVSLPRWHREGLRELRFRLFARRSTRTVRAVMSTAFRRLGEPVEDGPVDDGPASAARIGAVKPG